MGVCRVGISDFAAGRDPVPEIYGHVLQTTTKYGFGVNGEQPINEWVGPFGRWGWNEGQHESYAYTEVDETFQFGAGDRKSTRLNSSHQIISYAVFCLKKKKKKMRTHITV